MKIITTMRFLTAIALILFTFESLAAVRASFDFKQFYIPGGDFFIETHLSFDGRTLVWNPLTEETSIAAVQATLILTKGDEVIDYKKVRINSLPETNGSSSDFIDVQRIVAPPGDYQLEINLLDLNDPSGIPAVFTQDIHIELTEAKPCISDITFVEAYAKATEKTELTKSGMDILPLISDFFPSEVEKIVFYAEAYNSNLASIEGDKYLLTYALWGPDGEVTETRRYKRRETAAVTPIFESVDITDLPTGNYQLVIEMRTPDNTELASKSISFNRQANIEKDFAAIANKDSYVAQPGLAFANPDSIRSYVSWLYPIAMNVERGTIDSQVKANDTEVLQNFFQSFWENRAPEDPIGEWMKYVKDVWHVNKKYKSPVLDGYRTDRGRVYLQYGKPNTIVIRHNTPNVFPLEIWHYYKIERFNDKRFLFYSRNVANFDFALLHSDMLGEVQNHDWPTLIRTKNNDLRPTDSALNRLAPRDTHSFDEIEDLFYNPR